MVVSPFPLIGTVLGKLLIERVNAVLILPKQIKFWVSMLARLPVVSSYDMGYHKGLYSLGSKVPATWHTNVPRVQLMAYLVRFN